jgi:transcriptional regulator with GAF, ATPase, and Fis domain
MANNICPIWQVVLFGKAIYHIDYDIERLYAKEQKTMIDDNEFFREATIRFCGTLNLEAGMRNCLMFLRDIIPTDGMFFHQVNLDKDVSRLIAHVSLDNSKKLDVITPMPNGYKVELQNLQGKKVVIRNTPESDPIANIFARLLGTSDISFLVMPLVMDEKHIGFLAIYTFKRNSYTEKDAHLYSLLHHPFAIALSNAMEHREVVKLNEALADDYKYLSQEMLYLSGDQIIGADFGLKGVVESVNQIAPLNRPVLLIGETGVGKEVIANALHFSSPRKDGPFIKVNCGAIPEQLIDSELFGHEKGAFTGAISQKRGRFERANHGTILLDEIGELPLPGQVRLLRVLQSKEIERVGGTKTITIDTRIIAATHRNLEVMVHEKRFREDLLFRLNVFPIVIPPLRQRREDIPALVTYFLDRKCKEFGIYTLPEFAPGSMALLKEYKWPGNVRELENKVEQALIRYLGKQQKGPLFFEGLQDQLAPGELIPVAGESGDHLLKLEELTRQHIIRALQVTKGQIHGEKGAAKLLGINPNTLRGKMKKLGLTFKRTLSV